MTRWYLCISFFDLYCDSIHTLFSGWYNMFVLFSVFFCGEDLSTKNPLIRHKTNRVIISWSHLFWGTKSFFPKHDTWKTAVATLISINLKPPKPATVALKMVHYVFQVVFYFVCFHGWWILKLGMERWEFFHVSEFSVQQKHGDFLI